MFEPRSLEGLEHSRLYLTVQQVSEYYEQNTRNGFWPDFNAAVAYTSSGALRRGVRSHCLAQTDDASALPTHGRLREPQRL